MRVRPDHPRERPFMDENIVDAALFYHRYPKPGKLEIRPTKPMASQRGLALAYSPEGAVACGA
ncbi:MAG: hypothetical protein ACC634_02675, partial [Hyphomicrobiales bacterium]